MHEIGRDDEDSDAAAANEWMFVMSLSYSPPSSLRNYFACGSELRPCGGTKATSDAMPCHVLVASTADFVTTNNGLVDQLLLMNLGKHYVCAPHHHNTSHV